MVRSDRERAVVAERRVIELEQELSREQVRKHSAQRALWYCLEALQHPEDVDKRRAALLQVSEVVT